MKIDLGSLLSLLLLIAFSVAVGMQYSENKIKNKRIKDIKPQMKYTCGVEGGCEMSMHGTYDSKEQCESECRQAK